MIKVNISSRGLDFEVVADKLAGPVMRKFVERLADVAWAAAFYEAPWRTGKLVQSIVKNVSENKFSVEALAPYAIYVINGTAPHEIRPVNASCLAFKARSGRMVFTRLVRHAGTRANPFMRRAAEQTVDKALEVFGEVWGEEIA